MKTKHKVYILNPRDSHSRIVLEKLLNTGWQIDIANEEHVSVSASSGDEKSWNVPMTEYGNIVYILYKENISLSLI